MNPEEDIRYRAASDRASSFSRFSGVHGRGLGIGEVKFDVAGGGDGCDRCGFPDERVRPIDNIASFVYSWVAYVPKRQVCCPSFWNDPGVPPIWPLSWVFNKRNKYLNDNKWYHL